MEALANCEMCSHASPKPGLSTRLTVHPGGTLLESIGKLTLKTTSGCSDFCVSNKCIFKSLVLQEQEGTVLEF